MGLATLPRAGADSKRLPRWLYMAALLLLSLPVSARVLASVLTSVLTYPLPEPGNHLVGNNHTVLASAEETLIDISRRHHLGYNVIRSANPAVDAWLPADGTEVLLPGEVILPEAEQRGIVINVAEMRMFHYRQDEDSSKVVVDVYPVSVGRGDWATPLTKTRVTGQVKNPAWYPPESIRAEHAARGEPLPKMVPPGPGNPLGEFLLMLDIPSYFIHGTNRDYGIGMQVTHGCIRMYPAHISQLVKRAPKGTPVTIVNQPFKVGVRGTHLYLEAHPPLEASVSSDSNSDSDLAIGADSDLAIGADSDSAIVAGSGAELTDIVAAIIRATGELAVQVEWDQIEPVLVEALGIPVRIGELKEN